MSKESTIQGRKFRRLNQAILSHKSHKQQPSEFAAIRSLYELNTRPVGPHNLKEVMAEILNTAITLSRADMGNIQLFDEQSGMLKIIVHKGFQPPFLDFFANVYPHRSGREASCGAACVQRQRVIVEDVRKSPIFTGTAALAVLLEAGVMAVQSTPLISREGRLAGMLNTHYRQTIGQDEFNLYYVDLLAGQAADIIVQVQAEAALRASEEKHRLLSEALYHHRNNLEKLVAERTEELKRSERKYRTLIENIPMAITRHDKESRYLYVSPQWENNLGFNIELLKGKTWRDIGIPEDIYRLWQKQFNQALHTRAVVEFETQHPNATGESKDFRVQVIPELDEQGQVESLLTVSEDITERKKLETELQRLDRLNTVGEMAAAIGHEVRNPLTTVRGYLQMFQRKAEIDKYHEQFATMIEELDRANAIITDFLSLAKNRTIELKLHNLNDIINALQPLIQAEALRTGHKLKINMSLIPSFRMDEKEIRQLLLNLARNGFEAMDPGKALIIETGVKSNNVVLSISNSGPGIPPEVLDKLGTPFLTTKANGTGLGLAVCYRIADRHGARIDVRTAANGTKFTVSFRL
ncbi:sensor histidine kinase [Sporomusa termitida]|uniref:histidine kinase n=1 Tax=Sporomusa termitida TaxID=2377 RepID=A0A517DR49_9FIRM|nr:sensor histidine kinase [Sporomusa termitida]QDR79788.1 Adaptive-response sensory-kinase SasA [Sporomusa termitida]